MSPLPGGSDPIWHVSSNSGVATSVSELLYPCYFTLLYFTAYYVKLSGEMCRVICMKLNQSV